MSTEHVQIEKVLLENYMPYARGVIIDRAVPDITGLKPVNTRILWAMYQLGLFDKRRKASGIVGDVMKYHPNGDAAIYDAMVRMVDSNMSLLAPLIKGKGNYGKVFSRDIVPAAARYPEASLMPLAAEFFDGIKEDAVDLVDNYDSTAKEPVMLPVKFPNVLVNTSQGIAVGVGSKIPSFNLKAVCESTVKILQGKISNSDELMDNLGAPDFSTGGYIHVEMSELYRLGRTGQGSFYVSGAVQLYKDGIVITQIPYGTKIEHIINAIKDKMKTDLKEIDTVKDLTDLNGMKVEIRLKHGSDPRKVLEKLRLLTDLTMSMSFNTAVIINDEYRAIGIYDLLLEWIKFRENCIRRMYSYRYNVLAEKEHKLAAFEKIKDDLHGAQAVILKDEDVAIAELKERYGLDDIQANYIDDCRNRDFHKDRVAKRLAELASTRETMKQYKTLVDDLGARYKLMCIELEDIAERYGTERNTQMVAPIELVPQAVEEEPDTSPAVVLVTEKDNVIRLANSRQMATFEEEPSDKVKWRIATNNSGTVLLLSESGVCYKLPVGSIPTPGKTRAKEYLGNLVHREDDAAIIYVRDSGDYSGHINVVFGNGSGTRVSFERCAGNRKLYHNMFTPVEGKKTWVVLSEKFFLVTRARKAAYADLTLGEQFGRRAFKVARIDSGDAVFGFIPLESTPNPDEWTQDRLARYCCGYTVKIREDRLWESRSTDESTDEDEGAGES